MQDDEDAERENSRLTKHYRLSESDPQASDGGRDGCETLRLGRPMRQFWRTRGAFVAIGWADYYTIGPVRGTHNGEGPSPPAGILKLWESVEGMATAGPYGVFALH